MRRRGVREIRETFGGRIGRRLTHAVAHPIAWARYLLRRELRGEEVPFAVNPRFAHWGPMYRVARRPLAELLGVPVRRLDGYFAELAPLHRALVAEVGRLPSAGALMQAPLLYVLARAARPTTVVETGISSGYSARLLLEALAANGTGRLHSIGIDVFAMRPGAPGAGGLGDRHVGWLVPPERHDRWELHVGTSEAVLPGLLESIGPRRLDLFLHDSLHQYATMRWEYTTAWPALAPGGFLLSHDIHTSRAWFEFLAERGEPPSAELDHDLGAARVPA